MLSPHDRSEVMRIVKEMIMVVLPAVTSATTAQTESFKRLYDSPTEIPTRPIVHPFGLVSRAPVGTNCVTARLGDHASNRIIIGHIDNARKDIALNSGEVVLYNEYGQQIRLENGKINLGKEADEPAVLGNVLTEFLGLVTDALVAGTLCLTTTPGNPTAPNPTIAAQLTAYKAQYLTAPTTNILSQETFVERIAP